MTSSSPTTPHRAPSRPGFCALLALMCAIGSASATAQSSESLVFRCVQPDGHIRYAQMPCAPTDDADAMRINDPRTKAQAKQGIATHRRSMSLGRRMQKERKKAEKRAGNQRAMTLSAPKHPPNNINARKQKPLIRPEFTARTPGPRSETGGRKRTRQAVPAPDHSASIN